LAEAVRYLDVVVPARGEAPDDIGTASPIRSVTERVAADPSAWTPDLAARLAEMFDDLAPDWHRHHDADRLAPLVDALDRGGPFVGPVLELGAGAGAGTSELVARFGSVVALDLAAGMLDRLRVPGAARVRADASRVPTADRTVGTLVCLNMLLFADEVRRLLRPDGALVWVNTIGGRTPIHLSAEAVVAALGDGFAVTASSASWGTWAVARRR
jgi:SAM-dependent methyltransferase